MAPPLSRTWFNTLIDDDGSGTVGTVWNKAQIDGLLDTVDASLAGVADVVAGGGSNQLAYFTDTDTIAAFSGIQVLGSGQLKWPNTVNPSNDPTTLDDYREQAWTPTLWGATAGASGQVYSAQSGRVTKIGNRVILTGYLAVATVGTINGNVQLAGLPFPASAGHAVLGSLIFTALGGPVSALVCLLSPGQSLADLLYLPAGGSANYSFLEPSKIAAGTALYVTLHYQTG